MRRATFILLLMLILPINSTPASGRIVIWYDDEYPSNWVDPELILYYLEEVFNELGVPYTVLNSEELRSFMLSETGIVVFTSDVAPDTVWDGSDDSIILKWLRNGGVLFWTGDWEFYYIGHADGSMSRSGAEDKLLGKRITAVLDEGVEVKPTDAGAKYIPSFRGFRSMRPFDEAELSGLEYEAYGAAELNGKRFLDPCAVRVGRGLFVKVSAALREEVSCLYMAELIINRFLGMGMKLASDPSHFFLPYTGIVYILPSSASSPYWHQKYGDRIYFYVKSDLKKYETDIRRDFKIISSKYNFVIIVVPLSDSDLFRSNALLLDEIASSNGIGVLYAIFPKWDYGPEEDYLKPGSRAYDALLSDVKFLKELSSTLGAAVWYGWKNRRMDPEELRNFYFSLPEDLRGFLWVWLDEPFVEEAIASGVIKALNELNVTTVTELYSERMLFKYCNSARKQVIVTGYWNASSSTEWLEGMRKKLGILRAKGKILGVWIFWDENDGFGEVYRAYVNGELESPIEKKPSFSVIDASSEADRALVSSIFPSALILPGASLVVGGPEANPRSVEAMEWGVMFKRDELIVNGTVYKSSWGKLDHAIILRKGGKVLAMGTHRYGTEAALLWLKVSGLEGAVKLLEWRDSNDNGKVELDEIRVIKQLSILFSLRRMTEETGLPAFSNLSILFSLRPRT